MTILELDAPLRQAVMYLTDVTDMLGTYLGEPSVFTRRPTPGEATYPMVVISPNIARGDSDALVTKRPIVIRDLITYGYSIRDTLEFGQVDQYREVDQIAEMLFEGFHRNNDLRAILDVPGYHVIDVVASGPIPAPVENVRLIGRVVTLTIRLHRAS